MVFIALAPVSVVVVGRSMAREDGNGQQLFLSQAGKPAGQRPESWKKWCPNPAHWLSGLPACTPAGPAVILEGL